MFMITLTSIFISITITNGCKPVLLIPGFAELPALMITTELQIRMAPGCGPNGRNVTTLNVNQGLTSNLDWSTHVEMAKKVILPFFKENPNGIHVIGFSLGSVLGRALIEMIDNHTVSSFISIAGVHNGISGIPYVDSNLLGFGNNISPSESINFYLICYNELGQKTITACNFWRDEKHYAMYLKENIFLPKINNEVDHTDSERFRNNLLKVKKFVLIAGPNDNVVIPWQSGIFGSKSSTGEIINMEKQPIYISLGLKVLFDRGDLPIHIVPGHEHLQFRTDPKIVDDYILQYLD